MTVSKEALFERYKKMKAEGISITLMELKKQMEAEEASQSETSTTENSSSENSYASTPSGFKALSQTNPTYYTTPQTNSYTQENTPQQEAQTFSNPSDYSSSQSNSWTTSYYSQPTEQPSQEVSQTQTHEVQPTYSHQEEVQHAPSSNYSYEQQNHSTYDAQTSQETYSQPYTPQELPRVSEQESYQYSNNFVGNFSFNNIGQAETQTYNKIEPRQNIIQPVGQNFPKPEPVERNKYCLIGYPLGHSLSTYIHEAGFKSLNLNLTYELLETPPEKLVDRIKYLKYNNFAGFNVTIPLKLPVTMFLDEIDISADIIGAVNTVVINPDLTMKGYNTDVLGFRNAIPKDITLANKTVAILGTGGAARAAITALAQEQVKQIKIYTRNVPNSIELLNYLRQKFPQVEFNAFQIEYIRDLSDVEILVNTTPIGMQGRSADLTPIEENELKTLPQGAIVYDVIYNPRKTILLKLAQKNGYRTINGVDMFIHQAVAAEQIWTGKTPDFKDMKIAALENL